MLENDSLFAEEKSEKNQEKISYLTEIEKIDALEELPDEKLHLIDVLAKDFLRKKFHIKKTSEYSDLVQFFLEKNKPKIAAFCHNLVISLYSGEKINYDKIGSLIQEFRSIAENEKSSSIINEKPFLKGIFSPITNKMKGKKEENHSIDADQVGKETRKIIDKEISKTESPASEPNTGKEKLENENEYNEEYPLYSTSALVQTQQPANTSSQEPKEFRYIEGIDNMERIKQKILRKKRDVYERLLNISNPVYSS